MSVSRVRGFKSAGLAVGLKSSGKKDLALVVNEGPQIKSAIVYTSNRAQANPILWSKKAHSERPARAIILNSGGANCFTGDYGYETSKLTAEAVAQELSADSAEVQVCSTGLIGFGGEDFRSKIVNNVPQLFASLQTNDKTAAEAILTTDTVTKEAFFEHADGWRIGGIAKGAGMLAPGLATMLVVVATDAEIESKDLEDSLRESVRVSFNRLDSDGCMSTNDQVSLLSSGASGVIPDPAEFKKRLSELMVDLAGQLQRDAEGASHDINIHVVGAASESDAEEVGRTLARNNLFKAAIFGNDPNWGRVLAAIGTTGADFDPYAVDVSFNGVRLCSNGGPDRPVEECDLTPRQTEVLIDLKNGSAEATILTNDLTHEYVHENSAYSS